MFHTYILLCANNKYYTGITNNLARRLKEHQKAKSKSTKRKLPISLIYNKEFNTRKEARKLEVHIKNRGAKRYLLGQKFKSLQIIHIA